MRRINIVILIITLLLGNLIGCNNAGTTLENAHEKKQQIVANMAQQNHYSFNGTTSIGMAGTKLEDLVKISGFVSDKENVYFDLNIAGFEGMPEERMELAKKDNKMLVKYSEEEKWSEVKEEEMVIFSEFENWSPEFNLSLINDIAVSTEVIDAKNGLEGIRVTVDPNKMREQVVEQMRAGVDGEGLSPEEIQEMKDTLGLTDEEVAEMEQELKGQLEESKKQLEDMIDTLTVDSFYEIYYDSKNYLIQEMNQQTKSQYKVMDQKFDETVVLKMTFSNYGTRKELPIS